MPTKLLQIGKLVLKRNESEAAFAPFSLLRVPECHLALAKADTILR